MATTAEKTNLTARHAALVEKVKELAETHKVPGAAVGLYANGDEDYAFHGVTSFENPLEVTPDTLFQIGSTTKVFTGTLMMILAEKGLVSLDAPVRQYLPEFKVKDESVAAKVTVLQLLNHSAGWTGDIHENTGDGDDALEKFAALMVNADQQSPLGTVASYNNAAVNVAGRLIEKVTGKTYEAAVQEFIFEPLGMQDSYFFPADVMSRRFVVGHRQKDEKTVITRPWNLPRSVAPAGGIVATAADQVKFARFHLSDGKAADGTQVLSAEAARKMREDTFPLKGGALGDFVGVSWLMRDIEGTRLVGHGGSTNGQQSAFQMVPQSDFAYTILTNADEGAQLHRELGKWILQEYLGIVEAEPEPLDLSAEELAAYAGQYGSAIATLDITVEGDHLEIKVKYTEEGLRQARMVLGAEPPEQAPIPIKILPQDMFVVTGGDAKGLTGPIIRGDNDAIVAMNFGGRLAQKLS